MSEYIECRSCPSPSCRGCNIYTLATMLRRGAFDGLMNGNRSINPAADVVEVSTIKTYLQSKLDEWYALGDRRFEPENVWGYNFIMACFDDLAEMDGGADNGNKR